MRKILTYSYLLILALAVFANTGLANDKGQQDSLRILVYGASGKVGRKVVDEALARGHVVTAVSRDPSRISQVNDRLMAVTGDLLDPASVASLMAGQDVIVVSVRGVASKSKDPNDTVTRIGAENVVNALRERGDVKVRYIHVGGSGTLEVKPGVLYAQTLPRVFLPKNLELEIDGQVLTLEYLRTVTDVSWTYATPAKNFTNKKRTGTYQVGGDQLLENSHGRSRISRADFAVAVIDEAENSEFVQQRFSVAEP